MPKRLLAHRRSTLVVASSLVAISALALIALTITRFAFAADPQTIAMATAPIRNTPTSVSQTTTKATPVAAIAWMGALDQSTTTTTERPALSPAPVSPPAPATFHWSVAPIDPDLQNQLTASGVWKAGAPVALTDLNLLTVTYWDFNGTAQTGRLIVNKAWSDKLAVVFHKLFDAHFPLRAMDPVKPVMTTGYLMNQDNTRGFQARQVNGGWSMHAYGLAVDINPVENPWVRGGKAIPSAGNEFKDRSKTATGIVKQGDVVTQAFASIGWKWGARPGGFGDYMHFSSNGH